MDGDGKRVLIVDDDHHARFLLGALLDHAGYTVVSACDGIAALNELHRQHVDVVVTDYRMPLLNGIELLRSIHIQYPRVPVVLVSGSLPVPNELVPSDCQPIGWLKKPYDKRLLLELVRVAVDRQPAACGGESKYQSTADAA
jgi:DNA-binding NtrC family response regulator